jgi:hypothetical protein
MPTVMLRIDPDVKKRLETLKIHPRETYGDVIVRLIEAYTGKSAGNLGVPTEAGRLSRPPHSRTVMDEVERREIDID